MTAVTAVTLSSAIWLGVARGAGHGDTCLDALTCMQCNIMAGIGADPSLCAFVFDCRLSHSLARDLSEAKPNTNLSIEFLSKIFLSCYEFLRLLFNTMRTNIFLLFLALPTSTVGFVVVQHSHCRHSQLHGCVTTWSDYQSQHLDSLLDAGLGIDADLVPFSALPDATLSKAANSRAYWTNKVRDDKTKLRRMKSQPDAREWSHPATPTENWIHYRQALEALVPRRVHSSGDDGFRWPMHAKLASWSDYGKMVGGLTTPEVDLDKKQGTYRHRTNLYYLGEFVFIEAVLMFICVDTCICFHVVIHQST